MKRRLSLSRHSRSLITLAITLAIAIALPLTASADSLGYSAHDQDEGSVFVMTNAAAGNSVLAFEREADGALMPERAFSTGGRGTGANLGTEGALALSDSGHWLLAVNAGSNSVSVFLVLGNYLVRTDAAPSGGASPISVAVAHDVVYVLNGDTGNVQGFRIDLDGRLKAIANSSRSVGGSGTGSAEVSFNRAGDLLAVTQKATGKVLTWAVDGNGRLGSVTSTNSPTPTPYGFAFGRADQMLVSEANGGAPNGSSLSSYQLYGNGGASLISKSVPDHQTAACWVVVTRQGGYAYTSNTASDTLSTYTVSPVGELSLSQSVAAGTGHTPLDLGLDRTDQHLYVLNGGDSSISAYTIGAKGSLHLLENHHASQITPAATGLVAR
ncbi:MAG: beta-propeller fold lactonase family protein [Rhodanobacter sp.]